MEDPKVYESLGRIEGTQVILLQEFRDFRVKQNKTNDELGVRISSLESSRSENRAVRKMGWLLFGGALASLWHYIPKAFASILNIH